MKYVVCGYVEPSEQMIRVGARIEYSVFLPQGEELPGGISVSFPISLRRIVG